MIILNKMNYIIINNYNNNANVEQVCLEDMLNLWSRVSISIY